MKTETEVIAAIELHAQDILSHCAGFNKVDVEYLSGLKHRMEALHWVLK